MDSLVGDSDMETVSMQGTKCLGSVQKDHEECSGRSVLPGELDLERVR